MTIRSFVKGWIGEAFGALAHKLFLDAKVYFSLNNITLETSNGTTQIDHVIVSRYGVFVIETKNIDGWIFGDAKSAQWTQSLFGKKYRFQNPLHQNYRHLKALQEFLQIDEAKLISVVMFWGDCQFKTPMPENVLRLATPVSSSAIRRCCFRMPKSVRWSLRFSPARCPRD